MTLPMNCPAAVEPLETAQRLGHRTVSEYQSYHGLKADGIPGPITQGQMQLARCGLPDIMMVEEARWPDQCQDINIRLDWRNYDPQQMRLTKEEFAVTFSRALDAWNSVLDVGLSLKRG